MVQEQLIRILYIIYNENLLDSGILRSQVRMMLKNVSGKKNVEMVRIISFINPLSIVRDRFKWLKLKQKLNDEGIDLALRPILYPIRGSSLIPMFLTMAFCLLILLFELKTKNHNVTHSRSYGAGLLGLLAKKLTGTRHVFDPRGPLPEEMAMNGYWKRDGLTYKLWKYIELHLFRESDAVVAVTPYYKQTFKEAGAGKVVFIPNRGDVEYFIRESEKVEPERSPVLLFMGGMDAVWYKPQQVALHFLGIKAHLPDLKLKLITRMNADSIRKDLSESGVKDSDWTIESSPPSEMPRRIASAGTGLILGLRPSGNWPVKFAEYVACGVPVAVEKETGSHLIHEVEKWRLGTVLDVDNPDSWRKAAQVITNRLDYQVRCRSYARRRMNISRSADQYYRLYRQVLSLP